MIKVDVMGKKYSGVEIKGSRELVCLELLLVVAALLSKDVIQDEDKKALKTVLDLDPTLCTKLIENLTDSFSDL